MDSINWIFLPDRPRPLTDILFTDGKKVYAGWLETLIPEEGPVFYCPFDMKGAWPEGIFAWAYFPNPPSTWLKPLYMKKISQDILQGMERVRQEMFEKGLLTDSTTLEEMAEYAGNNIQIMEITQEEWDFLQWIESCKK